MVLFDNDSGALSLGSLGLGQQFGWLRSLSWTLVCLAYNICGLSECNSARSWSEKWVDPQDQATPPMRPSEASHEASEDSKRLQSAIANANSKLIRIKFASASRGYEIEIHELENDCPSA